MSLWQRESVYSFTESAMKRCFEWALYCGKHKRYMCCSSKYRLTSATKSSGEFVVDKSRSTTPAYVLTEPPNFLAKYQHFCWHTWSDKKKYIVRYSKWNPNESKYVHSELLPMDRERRRKNSKIPSPPRSP